MPNNNKKNVIAKFRWQHRRASRFALSVQIQWMYLSIINSSDTPSIECVIVHIVRRQCHHLNARTHKDRTLAHRYFRRIKARIKRNKSELLFFIRIFIVSLSICLVHFFFVHSTPRSKYRHDVCEI